MLKKIFKLSVLCGAILVWMLLIFSFSSQTAIQSNRVSRNAARFIVEIRSAVDKNGTIVSLPRLNNVLRKTAHFLLYCILAILIINTLMLLKFTEIEAYIQTILICLLYAVLDEFHQFFVPGRGPAFTDVLIDGSGAMLGILLFWCAKRFEGQAAMGIKRNKYLIDENTKMK